jgi:hypothetical protein
VDSTCAAGKLAANTVKDVWSVMDAAAEKPVPGEYMGEAAIRAVKGSSGTVERNVSTALQRGGEASVNV